MVTLVNSGGNAYVRIDNPRQVDILVAAGWQVVSEVKPPQESGAGAKSGEKPESGKGTVPATKTANKAKSGKKKEG